MLQFTLSPFNILTYLNYLEPDCKITQAVTGLDSLWTMLEAYPLREPHRSPFSLPRYIQNVERGRSFELLKADKQAVKAR